MLLVLAIQALNSTLAFTLLACPIWWWDICNSAFNPWELLLIVDGGAIFRYHFEIGRMFLTVEHSTTDLAILAAETLSLLLLLNVSIMHISHICNHLPF